MPNSETDVKQPKIIKDSIENALKEFVHHNIKEPFRAHLYQQINKLPNMRTLEYPVSEDKAIKIVSVLIELELMLNEFQATVKDSVFNAHAETLKTEIFRWANSLPSDQEILITIPNTKKKGEDVIYDTGTGDAKIKALYNTKRFPHTVKAFQTNLEDVLKRVAKEMPTLNTDSLAALSGQALIPYLQNAIKSWQIDPKRFDQMDFFIKLANLQKTLDMVQASLPDSQAAIFSKEINDTINFFINSEFYRAPTRELNINVDGQSSIKYAMLVSNLSNNKHQYTNLRKSIVPLLSIVIDKWKNHKDHQKLRSEIHKIEVLMYELSMSIVDSKKEKESADSLFQISTILNDIKTRIDASPTQYQFASDCEKVISQLCGGN